jgi:hypothetical protein
MDGDMDFSDSPRSPTQKSAFENDIMSLLDAGFPSPSRDFNGFSYKHGGSNESEIDSDNRGFNNDVLGDSFRINSSSDLSKLGTFANGVFDPVRFLFVFE